MMVAAFGDNRSIVDQYVAATPGSVELTQTANSIFPSGVTHDSRFLEPHGIYVTHAEGALKWDVDGNEYVDYFGGHGALLLGHNHPVVSAAVRDAYTKGTHFGAGHENEIAWGNLVKELIPCAERVRFTSSGTEATQMAIRLCRASTGRQKVLRFKGHFHGWTDEVTTGFQSHYDGSSPVGITKGVSANAALAEAGRH